MNRRWLVGSAVAAVLVTTGVVVSYAMAARPEPGADAGRAAATPGASTRVIAPVGGASPSAATSPTAAPRPTTTPTARPSATPSPRRAAGTASLAGRIRPKVTYRGVATHYDAADGNGACLFGPSPDMMIAAMNHTDYETAKACGAYVLVRASNGASVTVRITNECPLPCAPGQIDLSRQAFAKLANISVGRISITWKLVSPSAPGTMSIRYKTGSSRWWCGIQVIGHRNPVARLEVRTGGGWRRLSRTDYNYFLSPNGGGCGGTIRVTDIYGERLVIGGIAVRPDAAQPTRVQFARH